MQWERLMIYYGLAVKRMGILEVSVRKIDTNCEDEDRHTDWKGG
jgi:hypothetical protein